MSLYAPNVIAFWIAIILAIIGLVGYLGAFAAIAAYSFWILLLGFVILAVATLMKTS